MGQLRKYAIAFAGPVATAGSQFLLSLVLLRVMTAEMFGHFAFLLVLSQFALGIWSALFSAALPFIIADRDSARSDDRLATLMAANLASLLLAFPMIVGIALLLELPLTAGAPFALFVAVSLLRIFARTHAYAVARPLRVLASDLCYSVVLAAGLPFLLFSGTAAGPATATLLALSALLAMPAFGVPYLRRQFAAFPANLPNRYREIWKQHSSWSLLGVLTTEATINAHAYVVTLFAGPAAFAVLAASSLLTRPLPVVMSALGEFERAQMASHIAARDRYLLDRSLLYFRLAMGAVWLATALVLVVVLALFPRLIFPPQYALDALMLGSALWMAVLLVRALRAPESAMMQGAGEFRPVAGASVWSAIVSVAGVAAMLALAPPIWSIIGVLLGELVFGISLWPKAWAWRRRHMPRSAHSGAVMDEAAKR